MMDFADWFARWEIWVIASLVLFLVDMFLVGSGHLLALGIASAMMSALCAVSLLSGNALVPNWRVAAVEWAVLAVASLYIMRRFRPGHEEQDVNKY